MPLNAPTDIVTYVNAAARDAALTAPAIGQGVFLIDSGSVLFYYGPALGWRPPWNTPWGQNGGGCASLSSSAAVPAFNPVANIIAGLDITPFVMVPGREYTIVFDGVLTSNNNGDLISVGIGVRNAVGGLLAETAQTIAMVNVGVAPVPTRQQFRNVGAWLASAGTFASVSVLAYQVSGAGGLVYADSLYASAIYIEDVGPRVNPIYR